MSWEIVLHNGTMCASLSVTMRALPEAFDGRKETHPRGGRHCGWGGVPDLLKESERVS